jgi:ABC-2 type transport system permease protein
VTAVRAELAKLLTLPPIRTTAALTWAATALLAWVTRDGLTPLRYTQAGFLVLGVLAAGQEHQAGGQIRATLLAMPRRGRLAAAKAVALLVPVAPLAVLVAATSTLPAGEPGRLPAAAAHLALAALLAAAVDSLIRQTVPAVGLLLIVYLIAGPVLRVRWLPSDALPLPGAVAWTLALGAVAALVFMRRDP